MSAPTIIDVHMHIYPTRDEGILRKEGYQVWEYGAKNDVQYSDYGGDLEDVLQALDESGAQRAILLNLFSSTRLRSAALAELPDDLGERERHERLDDIESAIHGRYFELNEWICETARQSKQLVPFISADVGVLSKDAIYEYVSDMVLNYGAKGIKIHPIAQRFNLEDPRIVPFWRACIELDIPILTHSGPSQGGYQYAIPQSLVEVLKVVPDLRLIVAHLGGAAWTQTRELARAFPSTYFDCSEIVHWTGAPNAPTEHELAQLILEVGSDRVMMGSDFPWYDIHHTVERIMGLPLLSTEQKEAILGANAARILKL